jgi:phosphoribosylformylglycinamidine synthase
VSFYNQTGTVAINPTPVVGVLGIIDDVTTRTPIAFGNAGDIVVLLGETREELSGSEWAHTVHGHLGGLPPAVDLDAEMRLCGLLTHHERGTSSAHDISGGGLVMTLVESCLRGGVGARIGLQSGDPFVALFSESAGRAVVTVPAASVDRYLELAAAQGVPAVRIGVVGGDALEIAGVATLPLADLRAAHEATMPDLFG